MFWVIISKLDWLVQRSGVQTFKTNNFSLEFYIVLFLKILYKPIVQKYAIQAVLENIPQDVI